MPKQTPFAEISSTFKLEVNPGETFEHFACRATDAINKCTDAQWKDLTAGVQTWTNNVLKVREETKSPDKETLAAATHLEGLLPELGGFETVDEETGEVSGDDDEATDDSSDGDGDDSEAEADGDGEEASDSESEAESSEDEPAEETVDEEASGEVEEPPVERRQTKEDTKATKTAAKTGKDKPVGKAAKKAAAAPPEKVTKVKAAPKVVKTATNGASKSRTLLGENDTIKLLVKGNPYREGSLGNKVFAKYKDGMTVKAFASATKALDLTRPAVAMLRFDVSKDYVKVNPAK